VNTPTCICFASLANSPNDAVRQKIIQTRINHLQKEINNFQKGINDILNGQ